MGKLAVNVGSWVDVNNLHVNTGSWNQAKKVYIHNGAGWVLAWQNEVEETFAFTAGQSYYGTVLDSNGYYGRTKLDNTRGNGALIQGEYGASPANQRGLWTVGNGSTSGQAMHTTLNGRTIASLKVSLGLSWSYSGRYNTDGIPTRMAVYGTSFDYIPGDFNPNTMVWLGTVAWYPAAIDYTSGFATVTAATLGVDPYHDGTRYPVFRQDIDLTSQLTTTAKTALTNGSIRSFALQAYNAYHNDLTGNTVYYCASNEPGFTYTTSGVTATGNADAFRVKIKHTG